MHWPHLSPDDRVALERDCPEAMVVLLAGVPDDSEVEIVTKMDEKTGEVPETKKVKNPMPMYARLGFDSKQALEAKLLDLVEAKEDDLRGGGTGRATISAEWRDRYRP